MSAPISNNRPVQSQPTQQIDGNLPGNSKNASGLDKAMDAYLDTSRAIGVGLTSLVVGGGALYGTAKGLEGVGIAVKDSAVGAFDHAMEGDLANALLDTAVTVGITAPAVALGFGAYHMVSNYAENRAARQAAADGQSSIS